MQLVSLLFCSTLCVSAFVPIRTIRTVSRPLQVAATPVDDIPITVTGNNIVVTAALLEYVNRKLERPLGKLRANGAIQECEVHLSVNKNPKVRPGHHWGSHFFSMCTQVSSA